jgi:hypothetical protein
VDAAVTDAALDVAASSQKPAQDAESDQSQDAASDSPHPACDPSAPFGAPVLLSGTDPTLNEGGPHLTADELTLYFSRDGRLVAGGPVWDLFVAHRADTTAPFGPPAPLTTLDSTSNELDPMTVTELAIFFTSDRLGFNDIFLATRASTANPFDPPSAVSALDNPSIDAQPFLNAQPFLRADGAELWFASDRPGGYGGYDIYRAAAAGNSFASPRQVPEISTPYEDFTPTLGADGLVVFFSSTRPDGGAQGGADVWTASRAQVTDPFSNVFNVKAVNSPADDYPGWLSVDGCRLYMSSTRLGTEDLYIATRGQ